MLKRAVSNYGSNPRPEGWEKLEEIIDERGEVVASVVYWPWSGKSMEKADEIIAEQVKSAGRDLSEIEGDDY